MTANEAQVGGTHYKDMPIQPWDFMQACMSPEAFRGFLLGNVIKYAARHQAKGGVEDLRKAAHYLEKLIEVKSVDPAAGLTDYERSRYVGYAPGVVFSAGPDQGWPDKAGHVTYVRDGESLDDAAKRATINTARTNKDQIRADLDAARATDWPGPDWSPYGPSRESVVAVTSPESAAILADVPVIQGGWPGPDWSQAPEWARWWACAENSICFWFSAAPDIVRGKSCHIWTMQQAPSEMQASPKWGYTGDWRESLRKRPA